MLGVKEMVVHATLTSVYFEDLDHRGGISQDHRFRRHMDNAGEPPTGQLATADVFWGIWLA
jgi:hypothetical protein